MLFPFYAMSADGDSTEYFGALWDFIDWVYEALDNIKQAIYDYLTSIQKIIIYYYVVAKVEMAKSIWDVVSPMIDALNLTDVVTSNFGFLSSDMKMIITEFRIGEAMNILISAYATRTIFRMMNG